MSIARYRVHFVCRGPASEARIGDVREERAFFADGLTQVEQILVDQLAVAIKHNVDCLIQDGALGRRTVEVTNIHWCVQEVPADGPYHQG